MKLETKHLIIRNFELTDEADLCEYMLQRVNEKFEGYPDFKAEKAPAEIKFRAGSDEFFAIELKDTQQNAENYIDSKLEKIKIPKVIGNVYFGKRDFNTRELGYVLNTKFLRRGFGYEACCAVLDWGWKEGVHRVYAETSPENTASWKLMEKLGLQREAHFKQNVSFKNDESGNPVYWDTYVYANLNPL